MLENPRPARVRETERLTMAGEPEPEHIRTKVSQGLWYWIVFILSIGTIFSGSLHHSVQIVRVPLIHGCSSG